MSERNWGDEEKSKIILYLNLLVYPFMVKHIVFVSLVLYCRYVLDEVKRYEDGIKMFFYFSLNSFSIKIKVIFHVFIDRSYFLLCVVFFLLLYASFTSPFRNTRLDMVSTPFHIPFSHTLLTPRKWDSSTIETTNSAQSSALSVVMFRFLHLIPNSVSLVHSHQPSTSFNDPACIQPAIHTVNITYLSPKNTHRELSCCMYLNAVNRLYVFFLVFVLQPLFIE